MRRAVSRDDQHLGPHAPAQTTPQIHEVIIVERKTAEGPIGGTASAVDQDRTAHGGLLRRNGTLPICG